MAESPKSNEKLRKTVEGFLTAYNALDSEGKVGLLVSLDKEIKNKSEKDKKMYIALLKAARDEMSVDQAIEAMGNYERGGK